MAKTIETIQKEVKQMIEKSNNDYNMTADKHRRRKIFNEEDLIMIFFEKK